MLRERGRDAVGGYTVLMVNRRLSQCCHRLLGQQHPALCLPARPSELSRPSLYQPHAACFIQLSIPYVAICAPSITHHIGTGHTADGVLTACQSRHGVGGGGRLICGSPYMRECIRYTLNSDLRELAQERRSVWLPTFSNL